MIAGSAPVCSAVGASDLCAPEPSVGDVDGAVRRRALCGTVRRARPLCVHIAESGEVDCGSGQLNGYAASSTSAARMTGRSRGSAAIPMAVLAWAPALAVEIDQQLGGGVRDECRLHIPRVRADVAVDHEPPRDIVQVSDGALEAGQHCQHGGASREPRPVDSAFAHIRRLPLPQPLRRLRQGRTHRCVPVAVSELKGR